MKFQLKSDSISNLSADIIILAVNKSNKLCSSLNLNKRLKDEINAIIKIDDLPKSIGSLFVSPIMENFKRIRFLVQLSHSSLIQ